MEIAHNIQRIETRARAAGISIRAVCGRAEIAPSTFQRAKNGVVEARLSTIRKLEEALDALIDERRAAMAAAESAPNGNGEAA